MFVKIICVTLLASSVLSRNVPNFRDLDEDDQMLFKAAYDSYENPSYNNANPSYNYDTTYNHEYDNQIPTGKLDLMKDGMWALKAKLKELKAFDKALAANLLLTKLQVKELMKHQLITLKKHQHVEVDSKPAHNYQPSSSYTQYEQPQPHYSAAAPAPASAPSSYIATAPQYPAPVPQYTATAPQYTATAPQYTAQHYGTQQPVHDPYYGH